MGVMYLGVIAVKARAALPFKFSKDKPWQETDIVKKKQT